MDFHDRRSALADRLLVVAGMRAIGRADFFQLAAGARHDIGNAESAADLDQLAARYDDFFFRRERIQDEIDRGGVIVDDERGFCAGQSLQPGFNMAVTFAARAAAKIEFEIDCACHRRGRRPRCDFRIKRAPEIGV